MVIHNVSLFLPYTIKFHNGLTEGAIRAPHSCLEIRKGLTINSPARASVNPVAGSKVPLKTGHVQANEEFFAAQLRTNSSTTRLEKRAYLNSLILSDAHAPEWGAQAVLDQPKLRGGPTLSGSIPDFAKVHEELEQRRRDAKMRNKRASQSSNTLRAGSHDRANKDKTWTVEPAIQANGGLVNAVRAAVDAGGIEVEWIGTIGFPTDSLPERLKEDIHDTLVTDHSSENVYVSDKDLDGCYNHYCKTILWPVFHYHVPDNPRSRASVNGSWRCYATVNQALADKLISSYKRGDTIWVHDYHLLLVPSMVRTKLPEAQIGFFLHTAFPSSEVFRCLPSREKLLEGVLGANLIAFQTEEYKHDFLQTCSRLLTVETTEEGIQLEDHFVNVTSVPIGIDPPAVDVARQADDVQEWINVIQERYKGKRIIVARDKLETVHGVRQKLLAYELFLNKYAEYREKVILIQVATSTNERSELLSIISDICTRIDSAHSTFIHQPVVFLKQDITFSQYVALLSVADVLMITSLRDGMNLTAHEWIYLQDGEATHGRQKHGPLILSEFTGSASVFGNGYISINPWDYQAQAKAIREALEMSDAEKTDRWNRLHDVVMTQTGAQWASELSRILNKVHAEHAQHASSSIPRLSVAGLVDGYKSSSSRVFILDYEGSLVPYRTSNGFPLSSLQQVVDTLEGLMDDPRNIVYVMSDRCPEELESIFRTLPILGLIAENGCFVREYGVQSNEWLEFVDPELTAKWKQDVCCILKYYEDRLEGSYTEERRASLLFRYDKCNDQEAAIRFAGESADQINSACKAQRVHAVPVSKALRIEQVEFSKRTAALHIFDQLRKRDIARGVEDPDFLMVAGNDRDDEAVFHWANELAENGTISKVFTVSVGRRNTEALATLSQGSTGLLTAVQKLAKISTNAVPTDHFTKTR